MSKSDCSSEISYDSDDSEVNFIPGFVNIEVEEATLGEEDVAEQTELDPDTYKPYEDEPIASEEWVSEYQKKQETQLEFERKLQDRYDGKQVVNSWFLRGIAYREFTRLVHGRLGGRRIPLPACSYHAIRKTFPEESAYTGFETEDAD